jgi:hypothetical protein
MTTRRLAVTTLAADVVGYSRPPSLAGPREAA